MMLRLVIGLFFALLLMPAAVLAGDDDEAVRRLNVAHSPAIFEDATRTEAINIMSIDDARKYLTDEECAELEENIDWDTQMVLIFAWRGSGQDRMVPEYDPEENDCLFAYVPGRTRDLRPHVYAYLVPNDMFWDVETRNP